MSVLNVVYGFMWSVESGLLLPLGMVISIKDWVKDKMRLQETPTFVVNTTRPDFIRAIDEASERNKIALIRKRQANLSSPWYFK